MDDADAKFFARVENASDPDSCWIWVGSRLPSGYGMFRPIAGGKKVYGHRWAQERWNGPIPEGWQVDHLCKVPECVNPRHLEAVTPSVNIRRMAGWTLGPDGWTCKRGHALGWPEVGDAMCPECQNLAVARWREAHPDTASANWRRSNARKREAVIIRLLERSPLLTLDEIERIGATSCRRRLDAHWVFDGTHWHR